MSNLSFSGDDLWPGRGKDRCASEAVDGKVKCQYDFPFTHSHSNVTSFAILCSGRPDMSVGLIDGFFLPCTSSHFWHN